MSEPPKNCIECNEQLPPGTRFLTCKKCYLKKHEKKQQENKEEKNKMEFDLSKNYNTNGWILLLIFVLGFLLGAMIF